MTRLPAVTADRLLTALRRHGFEIVRQSGSHAVVRHPDGRWTTVPMHKGRDPAKGTLRQILYDTQLAVEGL